MMEIASSRIVQRIRCRALTQPVVRSPAPLNFAGCFGLARISEPGGVLGGGASDIDEACPRAGSDHTRKLELMRGIHYFPFSFALPCGPSGKECT